MSVVKAVPFGIVSLSGNTVSESIVVIRITGISFGRFNASSFERTLSAPAKLRPPTGRIA